MKKMEDDDEEIIHESMENAYIILTKKLTFNDLFDYNGCYLPYNPRKKITEEVFDDLIDYFCELEEYEKCAELKKVKESKNYSKNFINL